MSKDSTVEQALAGGAPQHFGWYRFDFADERWEWSPEARHRIVMVAGQTREVVVIGERMHDNATISEAVAEIAENRASIEQAKGILMLVYRIQADAAFDLLK